MHLLNSGAVHRLQVRRQHQGWILEDPGGHYRVPMAGPVAVEVICVAARTGRDPRDTLPNLAWHPVYRRPVHGARGNRTCG